MFTQFGVEAQTIKHQWQQVAIILPSEVMKTSHRFNHQVALSSISPLFDLINLWLSVALLFGKLH